MRYNMSMLRHWCPEPPSSQVYIIDLLFNKCMLVRHTPSTLFNTHYHTLLNTASWTVWPPPTTLYDQLWRHVGPTMFVNLTPAIYTKFIYDKNWGAFWIRKASFSPSRRATQSRFEKRRSNLCFGTCIHKREVLAEVHQTCWLQTLYFFL